jgi:aspartate carbamoyltransferase catalytic subunit
VSDLISIRDFSKAEVERLLHSAERMEKDLYNMHQTHDGQMAATLFYEPSTRTHLSFQTAAQRLGMSVVPYNHEHSSSKKGETLTDTIKIVDGYADIIVIRHPMEGAARLAADVAEAPVINAGDGGNQHPTQTLIDLYAIRKAKAKIGGLDVRLVGDLKHARAMRSLLYGLGMFGAKVTLMAPAGLEMDDAIVNETREKFKADITEASSLDIAGADVVYVCRIQKERFADPYEAQKLQANFRLSPSVMAQAKSDMILMHPLPKIDEIPPEVDSSPHAYYFTQARMGVPVRMAVLHEALGK